MIKWKQTALLLGTAIALAGCTQPEDLQQEVVQLEAEITALTAEKESLGTKILETKKEHGLERYMVSINIKQEHTILNVDKMIKDEMNDISIAIPVDEEFYNSVSVGTVLDDSFRKGSFLLEGSIGRWNITVDGKWIE